MKPLSPEVAEKVFDILVEICGANSTMRKAFVSSQVSDDLPEWRFIGFLGFGGKFRRGDHGSLYVDCYKEDETKVRQDIIQRANARLEAYWQ